MLDGIFPFWGALRSPSLSLDAFSVQWDYKLEIIHMSLRRDTPRIVILLHRRFRLRCGIDPIRVHRQTSSIDIGSATDKIYRIIRRNS